MGGQADVDLNPRIGFDWMLPGTSGTCGTRQEVSVHGGAMARRPTGWYGGGASARPEAVHRPLRVLRVYRTGTVHVRADNYVSTEPQTRLWLAEAREESGCIMPPYVG